MTGSVNPGGFELFATYSRIWALAYFLLTCNQCQLFASISVAKATPERAVSSVAKINEKVKIEMKNENEK